RVAPDRVELVLVQDTAVVERGVGDRGERDLSVGGSRPERTPQRPVLARREQGLALAPVGQLVHAVARESRAGIAGEPGGEQDLGAVVPLDPERVVLGYDAGRGRLRQLAGI